MLAKKMQILLTNVLQLFLKAGVSDVSFLPLLFVPVNNFPDICYVGQWHRVKLCLAVDSGS